MTEFLWNLLIVESVGWLSIALFRSRLSYLVTSALLGGWFIGGAVTDRHPYFALPAAAFHIAIYMALAWVVFAVARRIRPNTDGPLTGWRRWRIWSMVAASFLVAYQLGAEANWIDGAIAVVLQTGLFSAALALFVFLQLKAEARKSRRDAAIEAELEHIRASATTSGIQGLGRE